MKKELLKMRQLKQSAQVVQELIHQKGYDNEVIELPASTRTAQEAADALVCKVDKIAKTIVFKLRNTEEALLVVAVDLIELMKEELASLLVID